VVHEVTVTLLRIGLLMIVSTGSVMDDVRADRLLAQARESIGGEARLAKVQGFRAAGGAMQMFPDGRHVGDLTIELQLPDKFLRTDSSSGPGSGAVFVMLRGLNGTTLLRNSKIINGGPGSRMSKPPIIGGTEAAALRQASQEVTRFAIALLLTPPPGAQVEFTYAGEAESPDGKADVLDITGTNSFAARLFLDKSSHRPLMLTYRDFDPRFIVPPKPGSPPGAVYAADTTPVELAWFFEEYRAVSGIQLPHRISRAINGETDEEWTFKTFTLNPTFTPNAFTDK
jgi:hypothetical protein